MLIESLMLHQWMNSTAGGVVCAVMFSFSKLFTSSEKSPRKSPSLSFKGSTRRGTVRPVVSRQRDGGHTSRAFDFLHDDLYVYIRARCDVILAELFTFLRYYFLCVLSLILSPENIIVFAMNVSFFAQFIFKWLESKDVQWLLLSVSP